MKEIIERLSCIGIVPVVKITQASDAVPLAQALYEGGIDCVEITFRSSYAKAAIQQIKAKVPSMLVGAGTISNLEQACDAVEAGADFIVTPGFNKQVIAWCVERNILVLPGVSSASEIEMAVAFGIKNVKFFPAESSGGSRKIMDLSAPYPDIHFMPTGGINISNMHDYLSMPNVIAIGGSFMLPQDSIDKQDWEAIKQVSMEAVDAMLKYELIHLGIHGETPEKAKIIAHQLCQAFGFKYYKKPKSHFAGKGFEVLNTKGRGSVGHIGIYTPYVDRAIYHLNKKAISTVKDTITYNKKTNQINFAYLDLEIAGFGIHLINPDVKM